MYNLRIYQNELKTVFVFSEVIDLRIKNDMNLIFPFNLTTLLWNSCRVTRKDLRSFSDV